MFNEAGQPSHTRIARGGGKGGGGGGAAPVAPPLPRVYTDPVNGMTFTDDPTAGGGSYNYGGGYYGMVPTDTNAKTGSQKLNEEIAARQAGEKSTSDAAAAQKTADAATAETTYQGNRQTAYNDAADAIVNQFRKQGLDPTQYWESDIHPALMRQFNSVQDLSPDPGAAFTPDLGSTILNNITSGGRTTATSALDKAFSPTYAQTALPDTLTGDYVSKLVNQQFDPLSAQLTNAQKRGTLQPAGYQAALDALNTKKAAATSTVTDLGKNILATDRSQLNDYISGARTSANALTPGQTFDPNAYITGAQGKVSDFTKGFGGALTSAVGDTQYANLSDLINAGGAVQGASNPTAANPLPGAGYVPPVDDSQTKRGLGSTGAF